MRYDRLSLLSDQLSPYEFGYFHKVSGATTVKQKGIFRTNCMDCLDRTNVVQAYLAAETLAKILASMGVLSLVVFDLHPRLNSIGSMGLAPFFPASRICFVLLRPLVYQSFPERMTKNSKKNEKQRVMKKVFNPSQLTQPVCKKHSLRK